PEDQLAVTKLVPQVSVLERGSVATLQYPLTSGRLQQPEVRGLGLVPARDQPIDRPQPALGGDYQPGPAAARPDLSIGGGHRFQRSHDGGTDGDYPPAPGVDSVHEPRGGRGDL